MKSMTKRTGAILAAAALATAFAATGTGLIIKNNVNALAEETANIGLNYYYDKLGNDANAKNFYNTFAKLQKDGNFKTGKIQYNLTDDTVVDKSDVAAFVNSGDTRIVKAFGAGRDSYFLDNPDLFYVDVFGTSVNAGTKGNDYVAYLDSSRVSSLYLGELNSEKKVNDAIMAYETQINKIVTGAKAAGGVVDQIKYVNKYICDNVEYSYGTEIKDGKNVDTPAAAYIYTAYGSLVNGKAVCEGYAKGFKAVMDRLDIPCVCVAGYSVKESGSSEAHMWNAVQLDGLWYDVDVTWNDTANASGKDGEKWLLLGSKNFDYAHQEDNVVSSSGYVLQSPAINPYDYGVGEDDNGMSIDGKYTNSDYGKVLTISVSYEGKGGEKLHDEGKYFAFRYGDLKDGQIEWGIWFSAVEFNEVATAWLFEDTQSKTNVYANTQYIQFALINRAPDESLGATASGKPFNYAYNSENLKDKDFIVAPSTPYENEGYKSYVPAPWGNPNPTNTGDLPVNATYDIKITYTESLEKIDKSKDVGLTFTASRGDSTVRESAVIEDFKWDGDKIITFKFTPSKMYIHNLADYYFVPTNLQGVNSKKIPESVRYCFKGKSVVCSKVFNDGRLYMSVFGQAQMLDTSDLSVTDFKDENGNYYAASQRSQLMLVVNKPDENREQEMKDVLLDETPLEQKDIVASATYEIDLQICGMIRQVPNGSYMQVAFGFPEGYSANDKGTTFKIYHYKHDDNGNITGVEEIPVIVTEYGLIAKVQSFSPFTVVQVKNDSAAVTSGNKAIYATANGNGSITTDGKSGIAEFTGKSITYNITAEKGYQVARVLLNGKAIDPSEYANGTLTLSAEKLEAGNTLEAVFVTEESVKAYADLGIEMAGMDTQVVSAKSNVVWIVVGCVLGVIAVGVCAAAVVVIIRKKKSEN